MKIVFVVLHYLAEEETYRSVQSIQNKIDVEEYRIVIVDNGSPDRSGERLQKKYVNEPKIKVILTGENLGFAKGSNVGFVYAKKEWNPDYIVLMNNDVYLLEDDLVKKIDKEYFNSHFAVLGPLIMTKDGRCNVNPVRTSLMSRREIIADIKRYKRWLWYYKFYFINIVKFCLIFVGPLLNKKKVTVKNFIERQENVQLHGSFLVFSQEYINKFSGLDDRTFLYREEIILYKHMIENGMKMVYCPEIKIFHKEDASTDRIVKSKREEALFVYSNHLLSLEVLIDVYDYYDSMKNK